ncbi:voltage-dependent calcium channel beta subunit-associated regulatory protein [Sebastes umbrosus]|uniref:voltage-dependent calcium channel beta subunit-associated regulatory protein n=1 Tax=Sebastes umbrosus TaxID=72105 RepID=UPI00189EA558|nr:voltage-dependent calcium channel beta subunit-associated regulatory protein [Sebastes umbrosus]XP_037625873.1 voltage-dependent calcium channel beta subunit-associated regulatory protein [Sebastes umbrosus]
MSNESTVWNILPENSTEIPLEAEEQRDGYVLVLVILFIFLVGTVIFISLFLIACRRCCRGGQCCARASDDPEKTNTTYVEESQPTHEITIMVDESECLSMASSHDQETERFLSTGTQGRRVSFNEAALFDHGKKAQEKGRRYTLTEGDFHHLKNARLTHLHIPPPALKIVTIHECDSAENSITMTTRPVAKSALSIFQPMLCPLPQTRLTSLGVNPSCALPGDALNSVVDTSFSGKAIALSIKEPSSSSIEMLGAGPRGRGSSVSVGEGAAARSGVVPHAGGGAGSQGPVLQFFTKLRRHASLEGASPYFKIKKWKLDSSQRASSLDTRGSPKRRQFQRQRAASESMDQDDNDAHHIDLIQYIARTQDIPYCSSRPSTRLLSPPSTPPPSLGRVEVEVMVEPSCSHGGPGVIGLSPDPQDEALSLARREGADPLDPLDPQDPQTLYKDIWTLRASLEHYAASDQSSNNDRNSVCSDAESVCSLGGRTETERGGLPSYPSQDLGDEAEGGEDDKDILMYVDERLGVKERRKRKQDSTDSERGGSDGETGTRKLLQMDSGYASIEAPCRGPEELRLFGGMSGSPKDRTAHEKRHHFTEAGRSGTIGESFESHLFEEEPEEELLLGASGGVSIETGAGSLSWLPYGQMLTPREAAQPSPQPPTLHRRDYSIDEKTDALFHEFLRHDPQFDQQESPLRKHRSRIHLRKQWQRHKQWSDPGVRHFQTSFDRHRAPLRRGESVNYPLDTSYHSTLPRIVSAPDEETSDGTGSAPDTPKVKPTTTESVCKEQGDTEDHTSSSPPPHHPSVSEKDGGLGEHHDPQEDSKQSGLPPEPPDERSPPQLPDSSGYGPQTITAELTDKLTANLDERLYTGLRMTKDTATECVTVTATHASPDHSPV